jgi:hypothetical protein
MRRACGSRTSVGNLGTSVPSLIICTFCEGLGAFRRRHLFVILVRISCNVPLFSLLLGSRPCLCSSSLLTECFSLLGCHGFHSILMIRCHVSSFFFFFFFFFFSSIGCPICPGLPLTSSFSPGPRHVHDSIATFYGYLSHTLPPRREASGMSFHRPGLVLSLA